MFINCQLFCWFHGLCCKSSNTNKLKKGHIATNCIKVGHTSVNRLIFPPVHVHWDNSPTKGSSWAITIGWLIPNMHTFCGSRSSQLLCYLKLFHWKPVPDCPSVKYMTSQLCLLPDLRQSWRRMPGWMSWRCHQPAGLQQHNLTSDSEGTLKEKRAQPLREQSCLIIEELCPFFPGTLEQLFKQGQLIVLSII